VRDFFAENRSALIGGMVIIGVVLAIVFTVLMAMSA
jgi:hypothetical protein